MKKKLIIATGNAGKAREFAALFPAYEVLSMKEAGFTGAIEETGDTFYENALIKARAVSEALGTDALADDSGLSVAALGGAPGVYSARYAGEGLTDAQRTSLLLEQLEDVPMENRGAHFTSAGALPLPGGHGFVVSGECSGMVAPSPSGEGGFGYDPVFFYAPEGCTFADMQDEVKNRVSHRAVAMRLLVEQLERSANNADQ